MSNSIFIESPGQSPFPAMILTIINNIFLDVAVNVPLGTLHPILTALHTRAEYILRVLRASEAHRIQVLNLVRGSTDPGKVQLLGILSTFNLLNSQQQADFIGAFSAMSSLQGTGISTVARRTVWEPGHHPPINPP